MEVDLERATIVAALRDQGPAAAYPALRDADELRKARQDPRYDQAHVRLKGQWKPHGECRSP